MASSKPVYAERRCSYRVDVFDAEVVCHLASGPMTYECTNLSTRGALLHGRPLPRLHERMLVRLSTDHSTDLLLEAQVVRVDQGDGWIAVAFENVSPSEEEQLNDIVIASLTGEHLAAA